MNKFTTTILILSSCLALILIFAGQHVTPLFKKKIVALAKSVRPKNNHASTKTIAIITPTVHPSLEKIQLGFTETLANDGKLKCAYTVFNANGNDVLLHSQVATAVSGNFDLIFTIGAHATQLAKQISLKSQSTTPLIFGAVARPVDLGIVTSEQSPNGTITGVTEELDHQLQLDLLLLLKPSTKKILLVYNPSQGAGLEKNKTTIADFSKKKAIDLQCLEVYQTNEVYTKAATLLPQIKPDVLLVLKDNTVVPALDGLVKLCSRSGVTLYCSDLDSVTKGAALGFGVNEYDYGVEAAKMAALILREGKQPATLPIKHLTNYKIVCNTKTMADQGLKPIPLLMFLISQGSII